MVVLCENAGVHRRRNAHVESKASLFRPGCGLLDIIRIFLCLCEAKAAIRQAGRGGNARGLLITVGGAPCQTERLMLIKTASDEDVEADRISAMFSARAPISFKVLRCKSL